MATTNKEIILGEVLIRNIQEEVHTFQKWKSLGYQVKKGEKALFQTNLWKMSKKKQKENNENETDNNDNNENKTKKSNYFFMAKSSLFGRSQVEPIAS